jgi:hypothetical protein
MNNAIAKGKLTSIIYPILLTGLLAATLDAVAAIVVYNAEPGSLFKFIASGAFGKEAFAGGDRMIVFGVVFHFLIALSWTVLYFVIHSRLRLGERNTLVVVAGYGIFIWVVMNLVVLRFSNIPQRPIDAAGAMKGVAILIITVSLPIVLAARRFSR